MRAPKDQPLKFKIYGISACLGLGMLALFFFYHTSLELIRQMSEWPPLIRLEKRGFYCFGPFVALMGLSYTIYKEAFKAEELTGRERSILGYIFYSSILLTFAIPLLIGSISQSLFEEKGYEKCTISSGYSIRLQSDYYSKDVNFCDHRLVNL